jgi:PKD repeat protein
MEKKIRLFLTAAIVSAVMVSCADDPVIPAAGFTYDPAEVTQYDEVTFTNTSTDANSYLWNFGDGETSTEMSPVHMFTSAGSVTVTLTATNADGDNDATQSITVAEPNNYYQIDDTTYTIDAEMFWYVSGMGGDPYIRLLTTVAGQDTPDLLKLYPNKGLDALPGTYTWDSETPEGTYDCGYTAGYAGMSYAWTAIGKTGSGDLVITELVIGVYKFEAEVVLSLGYFDFGEGVFIETGTANLTLEYIGGVTVL